MILRLLQLRALLYLLFLGGAALIPFTARAQPAASSKAPDACDPQRPTCHEDAFDYLGRWEYRWGDSPRDPSGQLLWAGADSAESATAGWQSLGLTSMPRPPGRNGQQFLWLRTRLAGPDLDDPTLYLELVNQLFEARLDGKLIYRFGQLDGASGAARQFLGYPVHFIPLKERYQGRTLTLRIYSEHINIGLGSRMRLGSKTRLIRDTMRRDMGPGAVGTVLCAIGLFVLGLYLAQRRERSLLYYGGFAFTIGVWLLCQMRSRSLLIELPLFWTHVEVFALYSTAAFLALFMAGALGKGPLGLMPAMAWLLVGYDLGAALLVATHAVGVMATLLPFELLLLVIMVYAVISVSIRMRRGDIDSWLFAVGFVIGLVAASYDVVARLGYLPRTDPPLSYLGQSVFVGMVGSILVRRFRHFYLELVAMRRALSEKVRVLEARNKDIEHLNEELRHQIEARSKQLVSSIVAQSRSSSTEVVPLFDEGTLINKRYRVLRMLGQGAMGIVYEVERIHDGRRFAAKVLSGRAGRQAMARFAREAQLLAKLKHENLVSIADIEMTDRKLAYIIMEFVDGCNLADLSERYTDLSFVLPILGQLAEALAKVHAEGIVHRDLKPSNILVARSEPGSEPLIKVADFGVSALLDGGTDSGSLPAVSAEVSRDADADRGLAADRTQNYRAAPKGKDAKAPADSAGSRKSESGRVSLDNLTQTGIIMGTPLYMAPELLRGAKLAQPPSDIFSFGIIAYELLTGQLPLDTPPVFMKLKSGQRWYEPLSARCPNLPQPLAHLIESCLDASPTLRPTAAELAAALRR